MTWQSPNGERVAAGFEAALLRESIDQMVDQIAFDRSLFDDEDNWPYGVTLFDQLACHRRLAILHLIARHLFQDTRPSLDLTAVNEAALYAIYCNVTQQIEIEIDTVSLLDLDPEHHPMGDCTAWRRLVSDAYLERFPAPDEDLMEGEEDDFGLPALDCDDTDRWEFIVDALADEMLWDRDFEMGDLIMDADPEHAAAMKQQLGIDDDYFTAIADDPDEDELDDLAKSIRDIVRVI